MTKPEKVEEPDCIRDSWVCPKCAQSHCRECIEVHEVDFDVLDISEECRSFETEWKGMWVCPWCYNQLVDKAFPDIFTDPAPKRVPITKCEICGSDFENNDEDECDICGKRICHNCSIWNESRNRTICFECSEKTGDNNEDEQN